MAKKSVSTEEKVGGLLVKRLSFFERLEYYQGEQNRMFNTKSYARSMERVVAKIHGVNDELYELLNIDRNSNAL